MDLSKVSTPDLEAYSKGDLSKVSTEGLQAISAAEKLQPAKPADDRGQAIDSYLSQTDQMLGLPNGTSARQINQESRFQDNLVSPKGALGLAQMMPSTTRVLSKRMGRTLDPTNYLDALEMHREVMRENMNKFKNPQDAIRAYNGGWDPALWNNKETNNYVAVIFNEPGKAGEAPRAISPLPPVDKKATVASLKTDPRWIAASKQFLNFKERRNFVGTDEEAAQAGMDGIQWPLNNTASIAATAYEATTRGTQADMEASLYMIDQWTEATGNGNSYLRAIGITALDPMNIAAVPTLGLATLAKIAAQKIAVEGARKALILAIGRTGIQAGLMGGIQAGTVEASKQQLAVVGGQDGMDGSKLAGSVAIGATAGLVLGTSFDLGLKAAMPSVKRMVGGAMERLAGKPKVAPVATPLVPGAVPAVAPTGVPAGAPGVVPTGAATGVPPVAPNTVPVPGSPSSLVPEVPVPGSPAALVPEVPPSATLPKDLAGATPRWKTSDVVFESDIDKALYITAQKNPSKRDTDYRDFLKSHGYTNEMIDAEGKALRAAMGKDGSLLAPGETLNVPTTGTSKWKPAAVIPEAPPANTAGLVDDFVGPPRELVGPSRMEPVPTHYTAEEIAEITAREQKGRKWTDDLPVEHPVDPRAANLLEIPDLEPALRDTATNQQDLIVKASGLADEIKKWLKPSDMRQAFEILRLGKYTGGQIKVMSMAAQIVEQDLKKAMIDLAKKIEASPTAQQVGAWINEARSIDERLVVANLFNEAWGSFAGSLTRQRQSLFNRLRGVSLDQLMVEHPDLGRAQAIKLMDDMINATQQSKEALILKAEYAVKIEKALQEGRPVDVFKLQQERTAALEAIADKAYPEAKQVLQQVAARMREGWHKFAGGTKELFVSNLFSPTTLVINMAIPAVKTLTTPLLRYIVSNPLERARVIEMGAQYSAMTSSLKQAWASTRASLYYEQSILTRDSGRLLEGELVIPTRLGGAIRTIPRLLNASDEFLSQMNYSGFVSGQAAYKAALEGAEQGLKGKAMTDFVKTAVNKARAEMYEGADIGLLQPIVNKGINRGFSGEALTAFVTKEAGRDGILEALRHGSNKEGLDYVRDMLYKKRFSGDGAWSKGAKTIETMMVNHPALSVVVGQFFFRTLVRVFEEGIRISPGLQLLAPNFAKDLTGSNGVQRQMRAQGEALMGVAVVGSVLMLYAQGRLTGAGSFDNYKQEKNRKDSNLPDLYTVKAEDGSTLSFRGMDPLSTPVKILVNAFERWDKLKIREAQDGFANKTEESQIMAHISLGLVAVTGAISDANLVSGFKGLADLAKIASDPEANDTVGLKKLSQFLSMTVPNTFHKAMKTNNPQMTDPATFFQMLEARVGHGLVEAGAVRPSFAYDILGKRREPADVGALWNVFSWATPAERARGNTADHQAVLVYTNEITRQTGQTFVAPRPVRPETGTLDLRTQMTADGKETLYDRWQANYAAMGPDAILNKYVKAGLPIGTFEFNREATTAGALIAAQITELQTAAFIKLLDEDKVIKRLMSTEKRKADIGAGLFDANNRNK